MNNGLKVLFMCLLLVGVIRAAGFGIGEFGTRAATMGNAAVGHVYDASTLYYNPAGLGFLQGTQFYGGVTGIFAKANWVGADPVFDNTVHNARDQFFPPVGIHIAHRFSEKLAAGLSFTTPFGLGVAWQDNFPGRFISKDVELKSYIITPVVSYTINPKLSVAAGLDVVLTDVSLLRNILLFNTAPGTGTEVGEVELQGSSGPAFGFSAGVMYQGEKLGLGLSYKHTVLNEYDDAEAEFTIFNSVDPQIKDFIAANQLFQNQGGMTEIEFPNQLVGGVSYKITDKLMAEVAAAWYGWEVFEELVLEFEDERLNQTIPENYENVVQFRFGAEYRLSESFAVRGGYILDKTPQPIESVSPLLPDDTRNDYTLGFGYKSGKLSVDVGYMFVDIGKRSTVENGEGKNHNNFDGEYNSKADLFMLSLGYNLR